MGQWPETRGERRTLEVFLATSTHPELPYVSEVYDKYPSKTCLFYLRYLMAQTVKHLPTMRETRVRSLGWKDPLEKEMATHSSTLAWKIPWMEECDRLRSMGSQKVAHD